MPPNVDHHSNHNHKHHQPQPAPLSDPATSSVTMSKKSKVFSTNSNTNTNTMISNDEKENYNINHGNSSPAASTTNHKKRFHKFKSSLKEIVRHKVQQSRHCDSKIMQSNTSTKEEQDNYHHEQQQFSHMSEITLFHSTSTFDNLPSISSSMSSSATAAATGGSGSGNMIAHTHHNGTLSNPRNNNISNNSTHSLQEVKSKGCHNLDCILPPPPSSLISQRSFRHLNSHPNYHRNYPQQQYQQQHNHPQKSLEKKWFTLRDDPTVEESIECVFSHQLQDGSAILGLEIMDNDGGDGCGGMNHSNSGVSGSSGSSNSTDGINSLLWNDEENGFTSGKIEYVGVVNNHDEYKTNNINTANTMDNGKYNRSNNKQMRPKLMKKFRKPTKRNTKSDPGSCSTSSSAIKNNRKRRNQKQLENDNRYYGGVDHHDNEQQKQQHQHLNKESRLTKSLPPTMELESSLSPKGSTSPTGLSEQPVEGINTTTTTTTIETKSKSSIQQTGKEMSPILPKSNQWPQCPLLLCPSPRSGTRIRSVRYANEPNSKNLMDTNLNTMWWNQIKSRDNNNNQNDSYRDSCILPINNGNEKEGQTLVIDFESNLFEGTLQLRIRRSNGTTTKPYDDSFGFFNGRNRQYQCLISGRFKKEGIPMTECITGQLFDSPLKPPAPYITKGAIKLVTFFAPRLQANLTGRYPMAISPLGSTPQSIQVDDLIVDSNNNDEGFKACKTLLGSQEEPLSSSRRLIPLPTKATTSSSSSMSRAKARKKAFDKLCGVEDKSLTFRTDKIYTFEFLQHLVNFDTLEMNLGSMLGKYKLNHMLNGQPLKIMAAHQLSSCKDEKETFDTLWSFDLWHESILNR